MEPLPEALREFIAGARSCRIATVRPDGEPHVIPVCPVFAGESTLYVDIGPKYPTARAIVANDRVAVLIDEYDDDWSKLRAVLLKCRAQEVAGEEKERAWSMIREKFPQYEGIGWEPRLTLALRTYDWRQWGVMPE